MAEAYRTGEKTRADFCRERGITLSTLDYYLRRDRQKPKQKLLPVRLVADEKRTSSAMAVVLGNGRRIEVTADFDAPGLSRLIAVAERS